MLRATKFLVRCTLILPCLAFAHDHAENAKSGAKKILAPAQLNKFTGRVVGSNVRLRVGPEVESQIVQEVPKGELFVVVGEKNDFYAVMPPSNLKAFVFRSFVLDNVVEGNRVNVRLEPDLEAPVIGHLNSGTRIDGKISPKNNKWLEISPPEETLFYIAKEFIEYAGGPEFKATRDKRKQTLMQLMDSAALLTQSELRKPFEEMDIDRITRNYQTVVDDYTDFPSEMEQAKQLLATLQETYLQRKIAFLESKASKMNLAALKHHRDDSEKPKEEPKTELSATDRMRIWEPVEEGLFRSWTAMHHAKTMDDYYVDQKLKSFSISGILEAYLEPVKNKPGDYVIKQNGLPVAYVYSTHINLDDYLGKYVNLNVTERPNNNFAFPAFFALDAE